MRIALDRYGGAVTRDVELPDRGLVLCVAANGIGKTSLFADGPLFALFGYEGRRGDPLAEGGSALLDVADLRVERSREKPTSRVRVDIGTRHLEPRTPVDCDTATKATAWLEERLGPLELWASLCVLAHRPLRVGQLECDYATGTDADRKRLTELLVPQLGGFDAAREHRGKVVRAHERGPLAEAQIRAREAEAACGRAEEALHRAEALAEGAGDPEKLRAEAAACERRLAAQADRERALRASWEVPEPPELVAIREHVGTQRALYDQAARQLPLAERGSCPTCEQAIPEEVAHRLRARCEAAREALAKVSGEAATRGRELAEARAAHQGAVEAELRSIDEARRRTTERLRQAREELARVEERKRAGADVGSAARALAAAKEQSAAASSALVAAQREQRAQELAERALAPQGARAAVLAEAFDALSLLSNRLLSRLWPQARLRIERTTATEKGKVREVSRVLLAKPGEAAFGECGRLSRGELRRPELALLLARRQLLRAGCGGKLALPYLCLDEALDGLDEAGLDGCAEALAEEARHSLVVVLSHDERVRRGIPFVKHVDLGR